MAESSTAPKNGNGKMILSLVSRWQESLKWRIAYAYCGLMVGLSLAILFVVHQVAGQALRSQHDRRAYAIATNLSDVAAGYISARQNLGLHAYVTKYARLDGVAYAFIEDRTGEIVAHSLGSFPLQLLQPLSSDERRRVRRVTREYQGRTVYATHVPILEGQLGAAHVGFWADVMEEEIRDTLLLLVGIIGFFLLAAMILSVVLAQIIIRPLCQLTDIAGKISTGQLDIPVGLDSQDEIGELARSLERMRASLKTAMWRLGRI